MYMPFLYLDALSLLPSHVCMLYLTGFIAYWNLIKVTYFEVVKSKVIILLSETMRLQFKFHREISTEKLYNSLKIINLHGFLMHHQQSLKSVLKQKMKNKHSFV